MKRNRDKKRIAAVGFVALMLAASISGCRGVAKEAQVPTAATAQETSPEPAQTEPETSPEPEQTKPETSLQTAQTEPETSSQPAQTEPETSSEPAQTEPETSSDETYSNPIDAYFLPRINGHIGAETDSRELEDTYRGVWKAEFQNIMLWMQNKCVYQVDKDNLSLFADSVQSMIATSRTVIITDSLDDYKRQPDDPARNFWGTGTRSGLNQKEAEIYRDAGMLLVDDSYVFLDKDYSKEHYE